MLLRCFTWIGLALFAGPLACGQAAGVQIRAVLLPSAQVRPDRIPVVLEVGDRESSGPASTATFELLIRWNLLPSAQRLEAEAHFGAERCALRDDAGHCLGSGDLTMISDLGREAEGTGNRFLIAIQTIRPENRVGSQTVRCRLALRLGAAATPGRYSGWLLLRTSWR